MTAAAAPTTIVAVAVVFVAGPRFGFWMIATQKPFRQNTTLCLIEGRSRLSCVQHRNSTLGYYGLKNSFSRGENLNLLPIVYDWNQNTRHAESNTKGTISGSFFSPSWPHSISFGATGFHSLILVGRLLAWFPSLWSEVASILRKARKKWN